MFHSAVPALLRWSASASSVAFATEPARDPDGWVTTDLKTTSGAAAHPGPLLRLLDDGTAWVEGSSLHVPHSAVAAMSSRELGGLGLPPPSPHTLLVESGRLGITQPAFRFELKFRNAQGQRVEPESRDGALCVIDGTRVVLHEPQFSIVEAVNAFNAALDQDAPGSSEFVNVRLLQLAKLHELLGMSAEAQGGAVRADDYIREFRVVVPTQFTLALSRSPDGVAVDPELLVAGSSHAPGAPERDLAVPAARQRDFAERFRRMSSVRSTYALGGDWYVALPPVVRSTLQVVKEVQRSDARTRAAFASNPKQHLKARLEGQVSEQELEAVFFDGDYGERVSGVGLWQPKVLPWLKRQTQSWLPPQECGLTVGEEQIVIPPAEVDDVRRAVQEAIDHDRPHVAVSGHTIPATRETLDSLATLSAEIAPKPQLEGSHDAAPGSAGTKVVLLIKDNLENPTYQATGRTRPGIKSTPKTLISSLLPHQLLALHWLQEHWAAGTPGALLADDMGLGKTFETLAFVCWLREQIAMGTWARTPVLIVAPTGLLENWSAEMAKHVAPGTLGTVVLAWGSRLAELRRSPGRDTTEGIPVLDTQELGAADVVLTTYETLRDYQHSFCLLTWSLVVFDEAQKIKNPQTLATCAAKAVANKAAFAVALTGTPVENRLSDLWCIVDTVQPLRLGALKQFVPVYEGDGEAVVQARRALRSDLTTGAPEAPKVMMRRLKKDHLPGLPKVAVHRFDDAMPTRQAEAYDAAVRGARAGGDDQGAMLKALHEMRSVSLHPDIADGDVQDDWIQQSARMIRTFDILDRVSSRGEKALIFVEFKAVQAVLIELLQRRYGMDAAPFVINGEVPGDRRRKRVDEFQARTGFDVMLLSPRAGGVGLTLTAANHVIHLARWWNPAVEDQCTDRVNRIGQTRDVHVYLPMSKHPTYGAQSFDLLLDELLNRKRAHSEDALTPVETSSAEVNALFRDAIG